MATKKATKTKETKATKVKAPKVDEAHVGGQSAPPVGVDEEELNSKERRILQIFRDMSGARTLGELAEGSGFAKRVGAFRAKSWTRNSLRRLVREGFLKRLAAGTYELATRRAKKEKAVEEKAVVEEKSDAKKERAA